MLRLGLLVCDHLPPEFRSISGDYPALFTRLFEGHPHIELVFYDLPAGQFPDSPADCDAWMGTGSRASVNDDEEWIERFAGLVREIRSADSPFAGICFGHQMMAHALGGKVERSDNGWGVGLKEVVLPDPPSWLNRRSYRVLNSHQDQITALPPSGVVLGGNDHCANSLMQVGATMIGIQGHPEFTPALSEALIRSRRGTLIPDEVADAALGSLATPPDTAALADAIVAFLALSREKSYRSVRSTMPRT